MTERFNYPDDRETLSAARAKALEKLLIEKGVILSLIHISEPTRPY